MIYFLLVFKIKKPCGLGGALFYINKMPCLREGSYKNYN